MVLEATAVPLASPPSPVGLVVLEFTGQTRRNEDLGDGSLNRDGGDQTEDGMRDVPQLEIPLRTKGSAKRG